MADFPDTPPPSGSHTPNLPPVDDAPLRYATPNSSSPTPLQPTSATPRISDNLTQELVDEDPRLKRFQQDLLVLTSFNENETLHWRPLWFEQDPFSKNFWTLYNPPNVVTELLPRQPLGRLVYTRRMRRESDPPAMYIQTWKHWYRVCDLLGIPRDFLCEAQIHLLRLGLPRDANGTICAPPSHPLYPEPQPQGHGRYILTPSVYTTHLPRKFHALRTAAPALEDVEVVVVHSDGRLAVEPREDFFLHSSQWTHFDGRGGYVNDGGYGLDLNAPKEQGRGRRWCYMPWTGEMEGSCRERLVVKIWGWKRFAEG